MRSAITAFLLVVSAGLVHASALDPTFDGDGMLDAPFPSAPFEVAYGVAVDPNDGAIVAVGVATAGLVSGFGILRVLSDGTPDPGFGTAGRVIVAPLQPLAFGTEVVVDPDGHIIAAGNDGNNGFVMVRCATDGSLDPTFGVGGIVTVPGLFAASDLIRDPAGGYFVTDGPRLVRFDSTGALDPGFATGGIKSLPSDFGATAVARQSDGKLVLAGSRNIAPGDSDFWVGRVDATGSVDGAFGTNGFTTTTIGPRFDVVTAIGLTSDGHIVVGGLTLVAVGPITDDDVLVRYLPNGALDPGFGNGGILVTQMFASSEIHALVVDAEDRIVVSGVVGPLYPEQLGVPLLRRHLLDGSLDPTFPSPTVPMSGETSFEDVSLQTDGKIVVAGGNEIPPGTYAFHVRRYLSEGFCGNTVVDPGEQCDDPTPGSCCAADCTFRPSGAGCASGDVCMAGTCDGAGVCNATPVPDTPATTCDDGNPCTTGDRCVGGTCTGTAVTVPTLCTLCDPTTGALVQRPRTGCKTTVAPHASQLRVRYDTSSNARHTLTWQWRKGEATSLADLGDPIGNAGSRHDFCVFDESGPAPALLLSTGADASPGACATPPCWRALGDMSLVYESNPPNHVGLATMKLKGGADGRARHLVRAKGESVFAPVPPQPPLTPAPPPFALPLRAQLWASDGACWEATFSQAGVRKNAARSFSAKSD